MKRIGLMGGSFNPITKGHIELARAVIYNSNIEEVWLVPCYDHLQKKGLADSFHRLEMCELAVNELSNIKTFDYEIEKELNGSAYDFILSLLNDSKFKHYEFSYIIGEDNAKSIDGWKNAEELKKTINFITVPRGGIIKGHNDVWYRCIPHKYIDVNVRNISSSMIRKWFKFWWGEEWHSWADEKIRGELDEAVLDYVKKNKLYQ